MRELPKHSSINHNFNNLVVFLFLMFWHFIHPGGANFLVRLKTLHCIPILHFVEEENRQIGAVVYWNCINVDKSVDSKK